jgi:two-component system, OmpR family, response regulator
VIIDRQGGGGPSVAEVDAEYEFAGWRLNLLRRELRRPDGREAVLTGAEFALLRALAERPQRVLPRDALLGLVSADAADARSIDVQICRLRRKLTEGNPAAPELIRTLRGQGYMFMPAVVFTAKLGRS